MSANARHVQHRRWRSTGFDVDQLLAIRMGVLQLRGRNLAPLIQIKPMAAGGALNTLIVHYDCARRRRSILRRSVVPYKTLVFHQTTAA
jgi:hypothetical protein